MSGKSGMKHHFIISDGPAPSWILVKYFPGGSESLQQVCPAAPLSAPPGLPEAKTETFVIRPFSPADAQEVIRLLYQTYGYSYPYEHLYYPERLIALNADGSLLSLVAVSSQDELVGHLAMFFYQRKSRPGRNGRRRGSSRFSGPWLFAAVNRVCPGRGPTAATAGFLCASGDQPYLFPKGFGRIGF